MTVKLIRMWSGEDVIADIVKETADVLVITDPIVAVPSNQQGQIAFAPWSPLVKKDKLEIVMSYNARPMGTTPILQRPATRHTAHNTENDTDTDTNTERPDPANPDDTPTRTQTRNDPTRQTQTTHRPGHKHGTTRPGKPRRHGIGPAGKNDDRTQLCNIATTMMGTNTDHKHIRRRKTQTAHTEDGGRRRMAIQKHTPGK